MSVILELATGVGMVAGILCVLCFGMYAVEKWAFAKLLAIIGAFTLVGWMCYVIGRGFLHP